MDATALSSRQAAALADLDAAVQALVDTGLDPAAIGEANALTRGVERCRRRLDAASAQLVGATEHSKVFAVDGHRSAKGHLAWVARVSDVEAGRRVREARALQVLPAVARAFAAGDLGRCQVARIARVLGNRRVRERLIGLDEDLAVIAAQLPYRDLDRKLTEWERLADEDGAGDRAARAHEDRDAKVLPDYDGGWSTTARHGSADGVENRAIFDAFVAAELAADWAEARERLGDEAAFADLRRTDAQRRADAFSQVFRRAADAWAAEPGGSSITAVVVMDEPTFEREVRRLDGEDVPSPPPPGLTLDPDPAGVSGRCTTLDGTPVDAREAVAASLWGFVRRAVIDERGVTIDLGRRSRLFRGPAQLAARISSPTCASPGCCVPVTQTQTDHIAPWSTGGRTDQANAAPLCGHHNRLKEHGYTVRRDPGGTFRILRPDGTPID